MRDSNYFSPNKFLIVSEYFRLYFIARHTMYIFDSAIAQIASIYLFLSIVAVLLATETYRRLLGHSVHKSKKV